MVINIEYIIPKKPLYPLLWLRLQKNQICVCHKLFVSL